jgi:hypothetical protein
MAARSRGARAVTARARRAAPKRPVLVGLGEDELSVGAARVGVVRSWIRALSHADARKAARKALEATSVADVLAAVGSLSRQLELLEVGDAAGQPLQRPVGVGTLGSQA